MYNSCQAHLLKSVQYRHCLQGRDAAQAQQRHHQGSPLLSPPLLVHPRAPHPPLLSPPLLSPRAPWAPSVVAPRSGPLLMQPRRRPGSRRAEPQSVLQSHH